MDGHGARPAVTTAEHLYLLLICGIILNGTGSSADLRRKSRNPQRKPRVTVLRDSGFLSFYHGTRLPAGPAARLRTSVSAIVIEIFLFTFCILLCSHYMLCNITVHGLCVRKLTQFARYGPDAV